MKKGLSIVVMTFMCLTPVSAQWSGRGIVSFAKDGDPSQPGIPLLPIFYDYWINQ